MNHEHERRKRENKIIRKYVNPVKEPPFFIRFIGRLFFGWNTRKER
ncbi:MAG: hypothetical protein M0P29_13720 [Sphaerochaetaceae bacterium]|nr:hypothetical protein [Sphaerochaetaceae bacterium]